MLVCSDTSDRKEKPFEIARRRHCTRCQDESEKPRGILHLTNISWRFFFFSPSLFIQRKVFFLPKESNAFALFIYFSGCCQRFSSPVLIHLFYCISVFIFNPLSPSVELHHSLLSAHYPFITSPLPPVIHRPLLFFFAVARYLVSPPQNPWLSMSAALCDMSVCCLVPKGVPFASRANY